MIRGSSRSPRGACPYAVMQDGTVLCTDCVTEICDDHQPAAATIVHAWLAPEPGHTCRCCGASSEPEPIADER